METQLPIDLSLYNNANIANGFVNFWTETFLNVGVGSLNNDAVHEK